MASKTNLPIARLRSLGCKVSTLLGHDPTAKVNPEWRYGITLPPHLQGTLEVDSAETRRGHAIAYYHAISRQSIVEAYVNPGRVLTRDEVKIAKKQAEAEVAGLLNAIADILSKA